MDKSREKVRQEKKQAAKDRKLSNAETKLIEKIAKSQSHRPFGYLDEEDLVDEIWLICLEALPEWCTHKGPKENFLRRTVANRLKNRYREVVKYVNPSNKSKEEWDKLMESRNDLLKVRGEVTDQYHELDLLEEIITEETIQEIKDELSLVGQQIVDRYLKFHKLSREERSELARELSKIGIKFDFRAL